MMLVLKNIKYHRDKNQSVPLNEGQSLLMVGDLVSAALAQNGITADVEAKE